MLVIPGRQSHNCEGPTRRELLRAGSIGMLGLNLANFLAWQKTANAAAKYEGARGFGSAKSVFPPETTVAGSRTSSLPKRYRCARSSARSPSRYPSGSRPR